MTAIILRRRKLGRGSATGIVAYSTKGISDLKTWLTPVPADVDVMFRWGCTANASARVTVNSAASIHWCSNKKQGRLDMQAAGVPVPETWPVQSFLDSLTGDNGEYVLRRAVHAQGRDLWYGSVDDIRRAITANNVTDGYVSRKIDKVAEYRVFVCQGRVVWVAKKTPGNPDQVAWNVAQGGSFENVHWGEWPMKVIQAAIAAANVSGTDFSGVDVMADAAGNPYVLEVNSAPSQTSPYRQKCVAMAFDYIIEHGKAPLPLITPNPRQTWKSYIHPALRQEQVNG